MKNLSDLFRRTGWRTSEPRRRSKRQQENQRKGRRSLRQETLEKRQLLAGDVGLASNYALAHNYWHAADVDDNQQITAGDALRVINILNRNDGAFEVTSADQLDSYADVNADGMVTAADALMVINQLNRGEAAGELVELFVNARDINDTALTTDSNREINVNVGEIFFIELSYSDLRTFGEGTGAFQISADFDISQASAVTPVLSETQFITVEGNVRSANSGSIDLTLEGSTNTSSIALGDFGRDPEDAIEQAVIALGFDATDFEVNTLAQNVVTFDGQGENPEPSNLTYEIRFDQTRFTNQDVPNITATPNFDIPVRILSTATPPIDGSGNINGAAAGDNIDVRSRTAPSADPFGRPVYELRKFGTFDPNTGFDEIGALGPANPGGIPSAVGDFPNPFDAFSIPILINQPVTGLTITLNPGDSDEAILLYGRDEKLPNDLVIANAQQNTITINAVGVATGVTADDASRSVAEDPATPLTVDLSSLVTVNSGDTPTFSITTDPTNGSASIDGTTLTYTPDADYFGPDSLVYTATNSEGNDTGTISLTVDSVNDDPTAGDDSGTTDAGQAITIDVLANDSAGPANEGQTLTIQSIGTPSNGTATATAGGIQYTPNTNFTGNDTFTYTVSDGIATTTATVSVTVNAVSTGLTVSDGDLSTTEDNTTPVTIDLSTLVTVLSGGTPTFSILTNGSNGTASIVGSVLSYVPTANAFGDDSIVFTASNTADTQNGTIDVTIAAENDPPVAVDDTGSGDEDNSIIIDARANDNSGPGESDVLTITNVADGANGTTSVNGDGNIVYVPNADFNGSDSFTYTLSDGDLTSTATVNVTVLAVNDMPVAADDSATTNEDNSITVNVLTNDGTGAANEADTLTITNVSTPSNGSVVNNNDGTLTYTPADDFFGTDSFTYTIDDGSGESNSTDQATVSIVVDPVNDPPVAAPDGATTPENQPVVIDVLANDSTGAANESDQLSVVSVENGSNGSTSLGNDGQITYSPNNGFFGTDTFTYTLSDGTDSTTGTVTVNVTDVLDPATVVDGSLSTTEDESTPVTIDLATLVTVEPGDTFDLEIGTASKGTATLTGTVLSYLPGANEFGSDSVSFTATNSTGSDTGTINISITAVNDAPVVNIDQARATQNVPLTLNFLSDSAVTDVDGDTLSLVNVTDPTNGTVSVDNGSVTYEPSLDFTGTDSFDVTISDGTTTTTQTITVEVVSFLPSTVSGWVFFDLIDNIEEFSKDPLNVAPIRNGIKDDDENGLGGVEIALTSAAGDNITGQAVDMTMLTGLDGRFNFEDVAPGTYDLTFDAPASIIVGSATSQSPSANGMSPSLMQVIIGAEGEETVDGLNFGLLGVQNSSLGYLNVLASKHLADNGSIGELSGGGVEGGVVALNNDGTQQFFKPNQGFEDVPFAELVLNAQRDAALLTIIRDDGSVASTQLNQDQFVANSDGTAVQFFGSLDDFTFSTSDDDLLRAEFSQYRNAIDQVLADFGN